MALDCARQTGDEEAVLRYSLELLSDGISPFLLLTNLEFCLENTRDSFKIPAFISSPTQDTTKPELLVNAADLVSFGNNSISSSSHNSVNPLFTFQSKSAFAGSRVSFQLSLQSHARKSIPAIVIRSLRLSFNEQIPEIQVHHSPNNLDGVQKISPITSSGEADLSLHAGQSRVLEFCFTPIAQGIVEVNSFSTYADHRC